MFERPDPSFEPSGQTKQQLLYVRTRSMPLAGVRHPGYMGLHGYTADMRWFTGAMLLEGVAGLMTYIALRGWNVIGSVVLAVALILVDLVFAYFHHRYATGATKTLAMEAVIAKAIGGRDGAIKFQACQDSLAQRKLLARLFALMLILLAAVKFLLYFLGSNSGVSTANAARERFGLLVAFAVVYSVTALIHISKTGYFLAATVAKRDYGNDVREFFRSQGNSNTVKPQSIDLASHAEFSKGLKVHTHEISERVGLDGTVRHQLTANGLLLDSEISEMSNRLLDKGARTELALRAMELQLRMVSEE